MSTLLSRLLACVLLAAAPLAALAQTYPNKPIRLIVPFAPGGTTDIIARLIADPLGKELGTSIIVENRGGGGGAPGAAELARSAPDGYTLGMATVSTMAVNPACNPKLPYKSPDDFAMITNLVGVPNVVAVNPGKVSAQNMDEFVKFLKANPGKLSYASSGTCGIGHMMGELFKATSGTFMVHIPYRGSGPALIDLMGGTMDLMFDNLPSAMPHIRSGRLKALAVTSAQRSASIPELPTVAEAGGKVLEGYEASSWFGLLAPAGTPADIVARVQQETAKALALPAMRERLLGLGAIPSGNTPAEFTAFIAAETAKWARVVKASGAKVD